MRRVPDLVKSSGGASLPALDDDVVTAKRADAGVWSDYPAALSVVCNLKPGLAVAVCTYRRPSSLLKFLRSLEFQTRRPDQLLIVDASPDADSEAAVLLAEGSSKWADDVIYLRVAGQLRGTTRQRNVALRLAERDRIVFFDDDVVLDEFCVSAMEQTLMAHPEVVGVGAPAANQTSEPGWRWRIMRGLRAIPNLLPAHYHRSGFCIPLRLLQATNGLINVDSLPGWGMLWRTALARQLGFATFFWGYAQSEDVEFSRRVSRYGRLVVCVDAKLQHHECPAGRPNVFALARMGILNRYYVQRTTLADYSWSDTVRFTYGNFIYSLILAGDYMRRGQLTNAVRHLVGCLRGAYDAVSWRVSQPRICHVGPDQQPSERLTATPSWQPKDSTQNQP